MFKLPYLLMYILCTSFLFSIKFDESGDLILKLPLVNFLSNKNSLKTSVVFKAARAGVVAERVQV